MHVKSFSKCILLFSWSQISNDWTMDLPLLWFVSFTDGPPCNAHPRVELYYLCLTVAGLILELERTQLKLTIIFDLLASLYANTFFPRHEFFPFLVKLFFSIFLKLFLFFIRFKQFDKLFYSFILIHIKWSRFFYANKIT